MRLVWPNRRFVLSFVSFLVERELPNRVSIEILDGEVKDLLANAFHTVS